MEDLNFYGVLSLFACLIMAGFLLVVCAERKALDAIKAIEIIYTVCFKSPWVLSIAMVV
ncbi:MAG: hypothetical protein QM808_05845 [Steroidobacteraceae bacterium]